jgi:riboflavin transporter FmnP
MIWEIWKKSRSALTVMISPLGTNCHDIAVILLNVALHTINLTFYLPIYLSIYLYFENIEENCEKI